MVHNRESLLGSMELQRETVTINGQDVIVSELTASDYMDAYTSEAIKNENGEVDGAKFTALLVARCVIDEDGNRLLADEDAERLRAGSSRKFTALAKVANRLNGLDGSEAKN